MNGTSVEPRRAFGETTAFDVPAAGTGELKYSSSTLRRLAVLAQLALWLAAIVVAARVRVPAGRRSALAVVDETLIDLTGEPVSSFVDPGLSDEAGDDPEWPTAPRAEVPS